jgi:hypothetical protein
MGYVTEVIHDMSGDFDRINKKLDEILVRLDRIEKKSGNTKVI